MEGAGEEAGEGAGERASEGNGEGDGIGEEIGINTNNNETYRKIYKFTKTVLEERDISMYDTNQRVKLFCIRGRKDAQRPVKADAEELIHLYNSTTKKQKEPRISTTTAIANTKTKDRKERKKEVLVSKVI